MKLQTSNSEDVIPSKRRKTDLATQRYIPDEIMFHILTRLPVMSVLRFSCVSKTWYALFGTRRFISEHQNNSPPHLVYIKPEEHDDNGQIICSVLGERDGLEKSKYVLPFNNYVVAGVCHGLILIRSTKECEMRNKRYGRSYYMKEIHHLYCIWNPITGILKSIGEWRVVEDDIYEVVIGFGYSERNADYRALRMTSKALMITGEGRRPTTWLYELEVYSAAADCWTRIERYCNQRPLWEHIFSENVFFKGSIYFLGKSWETASYMIIRFDLDEELFSEIELPPLESPDILLWQLAVVGGDMLALLYAEESDDRELHVMAWLLNKESTLWTAQTHHFHLPDSLFFVDINAAGRLIMEERTTIGERRRLFTYAYNANRIHLKLTNLQTDIAPGTFSIKPTCMESSLISISRESFFLVNRDDDDKREYLHY